MPLLIKKSPWYSCSVFTTHLMFQHYIREFPVTTAVILLNLAIFIWIQALDPSRTLYITIPNTLTIGTFLAHFAHTSLMHIFFNLFVFFQLSPAIEKYVGHTTYALLILAIWGMSILLLRPVLDAPTLGFSGILMGLMAFFLFLFYHVPMIRNQLAMWLGINILIGLTPGISFWGHAMGVIAGCIVFFVFSLTRN